MEEIERRERKKGSPEEDKQGMTGQVARDHRFPGGEILLVT